MRCRLWVGVLLVVLGLWLPRQVQAQGVDPLANPEGAVARALSDLGYNPGSPSRVIQTILARADELVYLTVRDNPNVLVDAALFRVLLTDTLQQGLRGGRVFGGWSREQLRGLAERARTADRESDPGGAALYAQLRWDDELAAGIYTVSINGELNAAFRGPADGQAAVGCLTWRATVTAEAPGPYVNCLEYLLRD
jgi:hypothetical protein